jgi:hypothetical protein
MAVVMLCSAMLVITGRVLFIDAGPRLRRA